jgi:hypothetical protein
MSPFIFLLRVTNSFLLATLQQKKQQQNNNNNKSANFDSNCKLGKAMMPQECY